MSAAAHTMDRPSARSTPTSPVYELDKSEKCDGQDHLEASGLTVEIIDNVTKFEELEADWEQLFSANSKNQLVFQSHAWYRAWFASYRTELESRAMSIAIIVARQGGRLRLICPFAIRQILGMKCISWLGEPASQYGDVITDGSPGSDELLRSALSIALRKLQPDIVHLRKVRADSAILPWLKAQDASVTCSDEAPFLDFENASSFDDYCSRYTSKSRKNRRRLRRRLEEIDTVTTTILPIGKDAQSAIRTGIAFKQAWLVQRGQLSSALSDNHMCEFLTNVVAYEGRNASPFVSIMHCGSTPVSVQFGVVSQRRLALHMIAYNPETEKTGSGVLHIEDTIGLCLKNGWRELDFLAPNAPYKQAWADASMPVADYAFTQSVGGRLYARAYLRSARNVLKNRVQTLPLSLRQTLAKRIHS